jgi:predicted permease
MEGLVAASSAGLIGIAIAWFIIKLLVSIAPPDIPRLSDAGVNWQALCFATGVSFFMVLACSAGPIIIAVRMNFEAALREGSSRLASTRRGGHLQTVFILVQTAATVVLIAASLLIVGSVRAMLRTDIGFSHLDAVTMNLALRGVDTEHRNRFYKDLLTRLRQSPSVNAVGAVLVRPMEGSIGWDRTYRSGFDLAHDTKQLPVSNFEVITPGYFQAVGTPMIEGRDFTDHDRVNAPKVVIVSQGLAEKLRASGHNPIGARILLNDDDEWSTIVGVTARTRYRGVVTRDEDIYVCYLQTGLPLNYLVIRGRTTSRELTSLVRHEVAALDSTQAVANIATIGELVQKNTARQRFNMTMLLSFGLTSLLLTAAGLYSVIAEIISLKNREIAIRLALGSNRVSLVRSLIERIMGFVLIGETIGLVAVLLFGRAVTHLLYAIKASDPFVLSAAMFLVLIVAIIAASIPAWITSGRNPRSIL